MSTKQTTRTGDRLISTAETAQRLAVSRKTLWRWGRDGLLVPVRTPGRTRYIEREVEDFIESLAAARPAPRREFTTA